MLLSLGWTLALLSVPDYPLPGDADHRITRAEFEHHVEVLKLDGDDRFEAQVVYAAFDTEFQASLDAYVVVQEWIDSTYPGTYDASDPRLDVTLREDLRQLKATWHTESRGLVEQYFVGLAALAPAEAHEIDVLTRALLRSRVLDDLSPQSIFPGASTDLATLLPGEPGASIEDPAVAAAIEAYDLSLHELLVQFDGMRWRHADDVRQALRALRDAAARASPPDLADLRQDAVMAWSRHEREAWQIREVHERWVGPIAEALPEDAARSFTEAAHRALYSYAYAHRSQSDPDLLIASALLRPALAPHKRAALLSLLDGLRRERARVLPELRRLHAAAWGAEARTASYAASVDRIIARAVNRDDDRPFTEPGREHFRAINEATQQWRGRLAEYAEEVRRITGSDE